MFSGAGRSTRDEFIILIRGWVVRNGLNIEPYEGSKGPLFEFACFNNYYYCK